MKKETIKKIIKTIAFAGILVSIVWGGIRVAEDKIKDIKYEAIKEQLDIIDSLEGSRLEVVQKLKDNVIDKIRYKEVNIEVANGDLFYVNDPYLAISDSCNRIGGQRNIDCDSWGVMQFKITTIIYYYERFNDKKLTQVEALVLALDEEKARKLAERIIFEEVGGVWNWTSAHQDKSFFVEQIPLIRELEKEL